MLLHPLPDSVNSEWDPWWPCKPICRPSWYWCPTGRGEICCYDFLGCHGHSSHSKRQVRMLFIVHVYKLLTIPSDMSNFITFLRNYSLCQNRFSLTQSPRTLCLLTLSISVQQGCAMSLHDLWSANLMLVFSVRSWIKCLKNLRLKTQLWRGACIHDESVKNILAKVDHLVHSNEGILDPRQAKMMYLSKIGWFSNNCGGVFFPQRW